MAGAKYEDPGRATRADVASALLGGDDAAASSALIGMVLAGEDGVWAEQKCLALLERGQVNALRGTAALCLGHLARLQGSLTDLESVTRLLREASTDQAIGGVAKEALADIEMFT